MSRFGRLTLVALSIAVSGALACSSSPSAGDDGGVGGPVTGALDTHCAAPRTVTAASCMGGGGEPDGGVVEEPAPVLYNAEGDDDDCKYHVTFTIAPGVKLNQPVTFTVTLVKKSDGTPATGAIDARGGGLNIESYLADNDTHVIPNGARYAESPAGSGVYQISSVKFDARGRWVMRFHLFEGCSDALEDSPHGHVAFYIDVP